MNPLLAQFISEARDLLEQTSSGFLRLEKDPDNAECLNDIFRAIHTIKGTSGLFPEFLPMTQTVHAAEDVLDRIRVGDTELAPEMTGFFLDCHDLVGEWLDEIEVAGVLPGDAEAVGKKLAAALRATLRSETIVQAEAETIETCTASDLTWLREFNSEQLTSVRELLSAGEHVFAMTYRPDENCLFSGEDPLQLVRQIPELLALQITPREMFPALTELDYYRCILDFKFVSRSSKSELEYHFRYVPEQTEVVELTSELVGSQTDKPTVTENLQSADVRNNFKFVLEEQLCTLNAPFTNDTRKSACNLSVSRILLNTLKFMRMADQQPLIEKARDQAMAANDSEPLVAIVGQLLAESHVPTAVADPPMPETGSKESSAGKSVAAVNSDGISTNGSSNGANGHGPARSLKIDPARIDELMDLIGELIIAKNGLPFVANRADHHFGVPELAREIKTQYSVIDRISESLYQSIMQVRMLPVSFVFNRFPRLVRDLSHKLGKDIQLILEGEETEADKNIIEKLADPLIHVVRNSIDHGFEVPGERLRLGKTASGTLRLRAFQEGDLVCIEITDDGKGIDPKHVLKKAYEKGLIDESECEKISDREAIQLVFSPGFSTADTISDLSGRGVGMDVVRRAVVAAGGSVTLDSVSGQGTRIQLNLPLTMAVSRILIVGQGAEAFGVPMDAIVETLRVPRQTFRSLKNHEIMMWRDRLIPVRRLATLLGLPTSHSEYGETEHDELAVLVIRQNGEDIGVVVGSFHERVDTILKPFDGLMAGLAGYSGTAVLGDGRVLLILNFKELL